MPRAKRDGFPVLPPAPHGYRPVYIEDPNAYRPATPILNWLGPARSVHPPKIPLWAATTLLSVFFLLITAVVPLYLPEEAKAIFVALWIAFSAIVLASVAYTSTSRHLSNVTNLMASIATPQDMDRVVERLQNGRFSRFEEPWRVQVQIILMFCRLLRYHHNHVIVPDDPFDAADNGGSFTQYNDSIPQGEGGLIRRASFIVSSDASFESSHRVSASTSLRARRSPERDGTGSDGFFRPKALAVTRPVLGSTNGVDETGSVFSANSQLDMEIEAIVGSGLNIENPVGQSHLGGSTRRRPTFVHCTEAQQSLLSHKHIMADPLGDNDATWEQLLTGLPDRGNLAMALLREVRNGTELSKISMPVHMLEPRSLLEKLGDLFVHPEEFAQIGRASCSAGRMLAVCRWLTSSLHMAASPRKPYNPALGETFEASYGKGTEFEVQYLAEQVSHHPPISCFRAVHVGTGVELAASYKPKSTMAMNSARTVGEGSIDIYDPNSSEVYRGTWPQVTVSGMLSGPLSVDYTGQLVVDARSSGMRAEIDFETKGLLGGRPHGIKGVVRGGAKGNVLFRLGGTYTDNITVTGTKDVPNGTLPPDVGVSRGEEVVFFAARPPSRPIADPTIHPKPSRVVWENLTRALRSGDEEGAKAAKAAIEDREREIRRGHEARGEEWLPKHFRLSCAVAQKWLCVHGHPALSELLLSPTVSATPVNELFNMKND